MNILELVTLGIEMKIHIPRKRVLDGPTESGEEFTYWGRPESGSLENCKPCKLIQPYNETQKVDAISSNVLPKIRMCFSSLYHQGSSCSHKLETVLGLTWTQREWRSITYRVIIKLLFILPS